VLYFYHQSHIDGYFLNGIVEAWLNVFSKCPNSLGANELVLCQENGHVKQREIAELMQLIWYYSLQVERRFIAKKGQTFNNYSGDLKWEVHFSRISLSLSFL
jgi:hypothetical protein